MQAIGIAAWGYAAICALWGVRSGRIDIRAVERTAFFLLAGSITATTVLVIAQGMDILRTILPVSYTHLDVYKRQAIRLSR